MSLLLLFACGSTPGPTVLPEPTWLDALAEDPAGFEELMQRDGRDAWVDLHAGRPEQAWSKMKSDAGRHRAAREARTLFDALAAVHRSAAIELARSWTDAPTEVVAAAGFAADCSIRPDDPVLAARFEARGSPEVDTRAVWTIEENDFSRRIHNPCAEWSAARAWEAREGPVAGLGDALFGPVVTRSDGVHTAQGARDDLSEIRRRLELRRVSRTASNDVVADLDAERIAVVRTAISLASRALDAGDAEYARILLQLAHPGERPEVGPGSPPLLYAELARAELLSGNPRGALDGLTALATRAAGVRETVSDLAVMRGLSRVGDSKEE